MTIPRELQRSTPRAVSLSRAGRKTILRGCGNILFIVALGVMAGEQKAKVTISRSRNPAVTLAQQGRSQWLSWEWRAGAGLLLAAVIGGLRIRRQSQLLMYGRAAVASVTEVVTPFWYHFRRGNRRLRPRRLRCEYRLLNGRTATTTVDTQDPGPLADSEIVILYDPDQPEKALFYPARLLQIDGS